MPFPHTATNCSSSLDQKRKRILINATFTMADNSNPGNFANRPQEEVSNIASKGGQTGTENSGFASMAKEKVQDIASQGGQASSGSFEKGSQKAKEAGAKGGQSS
ncbi:hypothetical protein WHR41_07564 [Cladosporium halotolerans]|uniref:Conidiation-specific protein 10 n=1 Tax=Cladosporium halotolerans TaxID=1052096 RepID=A0AB34KGX8_9PEZI